MKKPLLLSQSGYSGRPLIHTDLGLAPVTFFWWATTPKGKQSNITKSHTFYRLQSSGKMRRGSDGLLHGIRVPTRHYSSAIAELAGIAQNLAYAILPPIAKGYAWQGPYLYQEPGLPPLVGTDDFALALAASEGQADVNISRAARNNGPIDLEKLQTLAAAILSGPAKSNAFDDLSLKKETAE